MNQGMRWRLRQATADAHARVDAALGALALATRPGYASFLSTVAAATLPLEAAMAALGVEVELPGWSDRRCGEGLLADLSGLGAGLVRIDLDPPPEGPGAALGMAYVLEGSRLGSRLILGRVLDAGDPLLAANSRHLRRCEDLAAWRATLARVEEVAGDPAAAEGALRGAAYAFAAFERACPVPAAAAA